jgi:uncharacterized flavoprotein (TIGR03862 family)
MAKKNISIIGGGPSALIFAAIINTNKFNVTIYEKGNNVGRKFLVAGDGGLNLTHSEIPEEFIVKYTPTKFIKPYFQKFNNYNLINWINDIGIETFVGSSKRVFPLKVIKPITVLNCIIDKIKANDVTINTLHEWMGWDHNNLVFKTPLGEKQVETDFTIFALGGASWSVTGSDGKWIEKFAEKGIKTVPFQASNCAFQINWSESFINENEGSFLKNISISCGSLTKKGELTITKLGLEGGAIYALSHKIRSQINSLPVSARCSSTGTTLLIRGRELRSKPTMTQSADTSFTCCMVRPQASFGRTRCTHHLSSMQSTNLTHQHLPAV